VVPGSGSGGAKCWGGKARARVHGAGQSAAQTVQVWDLGIDMRPHWRLPPLLHPIQVAIDYNAGYTGTLAALIAMRA